MSKFSLDVLTRNIHPYIESHDPDVLLGAEFGEDVALTRISEGLLVSHIDPIIGAAKNIGSLAVHVACNDVATSGTPPRWLQLLVIVPHKEDESLLAEIMRDVKRAVDETGTTIIGGHTGYSANQTRPLVAVCAMGTLYDRHAVFTKGACVGDHIFITKGIALEGTAILANDFIDIGLKLGLNNQDFEEANRLLTSISIIPEALILAQHGATSMHDVTRGGLLETLLEIAKLSEVGVEIDSGRLIIPPVVYRFSKAFKFDPYKMISSGTLVAAIPAEHVKAAVKALTEKGITFADIGQITPEYGVKIHQDDQDVEYQDIHCEEDELARMWELYREN